MSIQIVSRKSQDRGHADHDWLKTFHTFSFAMYYDHQHQEHGPLRVINEDRVAARTGFGTHPHREFEIFSYIVSGQLEHKDSMKNTEIMKRGDIQMTSAGTGIAHSEHAPKSSPDPVHFLQIWAKPHTARLPPRYFTRHFDDNSKLNNLLKVVAPVGADGVSEERETEGPAPIHSDLTMYASILEPGKTVEGTFHGKKGYVHVIQTSGYNTGPAKGATIQAVFKKDSEEQQLELKEGDGAYLNFTPGTAVSLTNSGSSKAEFILFDMESQ